MLLITTKPRACRACTGVIGQGTVISWVLGKGPYHTACSPIPDDAAHKHYPMIPLDCSAPSLEEAAPLPPVKISLQRRVLVVVSGLWALLTFVFALNISHGRPVGAVSAFSILGLAPVGIVWGIIWIFSAKRAEHSRDRA
jgi:hypothetical protein